MDKVSGRLYVFFEDPFWIGVFERIIDGKLSVAKVTFGSEPKDNELYEFIQKNHSQLRFSPAVETVLKDVKQNPKRLQRDVHRQIQNIGIGTKSQQALKLHHEQSKTERIVISRLQKEAKKQHQFEQKQQKSKQKHKGR